MSLSTSSHVYEQHQQHPHNPDSYLQGEGSGGSRTNLLSFHSAPSPRVLVFLTKPWGFSLNTFGWAYVEPSQLIFSDCVVRASSLVSTHSRGLLSASSPQSSQLSRSYLEVIVESLSLLTSPATCDSSVSSVDSTLPHTQPTPFLHLCFHQPHLSHGFHLKTPTVASGLPSSPASTFCTQ